MTLGLLIVLSGFFVGGDSPKDEAGKFARHLTGAVQFIGETHVTQVPASQMVRWALEGLYKEIKEPVPPELRNQMMTLDKQSRENLLGLIKAVRANLGRRKELEDGKDLESCLRAISARLEPGARPEDRSRYSPPPEIRHIIYAYFPVGIGLSVKTDAETGMLRVVTPVLNGPAYKAGLRAGDLITHIRLDTEAGGKPLPNPRILSTKGMSVQQAQELFLGRGGTRVILIAIPAGPEKATK